MFSFGFTMKDVLRIAWTAVFAFVAVYAAAVTGSGDFHDFASAKAAALALLPAAIAAFLSAVKNGVLSDASRVK